MKMKTDTLSDQVYTPWIYTLLDIHLKNVFQKIDPRNTITKYSHSGNYPNVHQQ